MKTEVVIVGGGLAGMAAALALPADQFKVTLIEAKNRLGGRVGSFYDETTQQYVDYCQHVGMACCTNLIQFLELLGVEDQWKRQPCLHFFLEHGRYLPLQAWPIPAPFHLASLILKWPGLRLRDRMAIIVGLWSLMRWNRQVSNNPQLAIDWLLEHGQSQQAIDKFWRLILVSALGEKIERVTVEAARKVIIDGFVTNRRAYHLLVPQRPLAELMAEKAQTVLTGQNVELRFGERAQSFAWHENACRGVWLSDGSFVGGDEVIVSVPWHQISRLFSSKPIDGSQLGSSASKPMAPAPEPCLAWAERWSGLQSAPITGVHLWWDQPWLEKPHAILVDRLCHWVFADPNTQRQPLNSTDPTSFYTQVVISGSRELPKGNSARVIEAVEQDLRDVFPTLRGIRLLRATVVTDPNSVFSISPESLDLRPPTDLFAAHHLWLAGDWTDTGWPATMEGAIRSGFAAAALVAKSSRAINLEPIQDLPPGYIARWLVR
jgi:squalene-associated FAD-dependent desaturase